MNPEKYQQAKTIFAKAIEMEDQQREAYLAQACAGDEGLRELVNSLVRADKSKSAEDFLEKPPLEILAAEQPEQSLSGKRIGSYRIVREIGHGGMGAVYLAMRDDEQFKKQVALKIIKRGMDSQQEILRRFRAERQILATLTHSNIARLLDGGATEDGLPYFVMEYIEGQPIDEYCDSHKLTTRKRLELFRKVCAAVQHAHRHTIVHRDLKPSNILVDADGEPKLLDFGIAKLLNPDLSPISMPMIASMMQFMTPQYASPEQVRGEPITTASDVYSLGVLLYELLTGHRPYQLKSRIPQEIERIICESEPLKPSTIITHVEEITAADGTLEDRITPESVSQTRDGKPDTLRRRLMGDIDNIVLMALRKEPQRRYESVRQFSEDIRLHLVGLPVIAREDTTWYRASRFVKRHKVGVIATTLLMISLLGGIIGTAWQAKAAAEERDIARLEAQKAEQVSQFLIDLFEVSDPNEAKGDTITAREILERGAKKIETELKDQPAVRATMANVIGKVYQSLGLYDRAAEFIEMGLNIRQELYRGDHEELAESYNDWGAILNVQEKYHDAEQAAKRALEMRRHVFGDGHLKVAESLDNLARLLHNQGKYEEAEPFYRQALEIVEAQLGQDHPAVTNSLNNLAELLHDQGKYEEAEPLYRRTLEIVETHLGRDHPDIGNSLNNLARLLKDQGRYAEAEHLYLQALEIYKMRFDVDHPNVADGLTNLAELFRVQGRYSEAESLLRQALEIYEVRFAADHSRVATGLNNLAVLFRTQGRYSEAELLYRRALDIVEAQLGSNHPYVATSLNNLARLLHVLGRYEEAESLFRRAIEIREAQLGKDHPDVGVSLSNLAELLRVQGQHEEAERFFRRSLEIFETQMGQEHPFMAQSLNNLARLLHDLKRYEEAEPLFRRALEIREAQLGKDHPHVAMSLSSLAELYGDQGKYIEAESLYKRALEIREAKLGKDHPDVAISLSGLAELYGDQGKYIEAESLYKRALEIREAKLGKDHPKTVEVRKSYEELLEKMNAAQ